MKSCSTSPTIRVAKNAERPFWPPKPGEMQINRTKKYHFAPVRMVTLTNLKTRNAGDGVEKREPCYADGGNVNCQRPLWRSVYCFLKKSTKQSYRACGIPLLGVYRVKTINRQDTGTPTFSGALFTRASTWKQP